MRTSGATDHVYMQTVGVPGFQFIQDPLDYGSLRHHTNLDTFDGLKAEDMREGAIILAASGMCEAGRIRHHLFHNLARRDSTILFVGFQAEGSLGRVILDGAERVRISGKDVAVRAQIRRIDSYSAHADQGELLDWIADRAPILGGLFLTHGEAAGQEVLRRLDRIERVLDEREQRVAGRGAVAGVRPRTCTLPRAVISTVPLPCLCAAAQSPAMASSWSRPAAPARR